MEGMACRDCEAEIGEFDGFQRSKEEEEVGLGLSRKLGSILILRDCF